MLQMVSVNPYAISESTLLDPLRSLDRDFPFLRKRSGTGGKPLTSTTQINGIANSTAYKLEINFQPLLNGFVLWFPR
jgi:hypothetical protein